MAPPRAKYKFTMRACENCMTADAILRKINPPRKERCRRQYQHWVGETPCRMARLKERTSGLRALRRKEKMKKLKWVAGLALAAMMAAVPVLAQEAAKKEPPKPAPSPSQAVLEQWNDIGRELIIIAEDCAED